ncbi:hypothetical protein HN858_02225 [Candidatus Falkowbacteria bacterium]|nr:hypothetical protein [Candidatus Falkowbacteria bacterium]
MFTSILLAKVFGLFFVVIALFMALRKKFFNEVLKEIKHDEGWVFLFGTFTLVIGLLMIFGHNVWVDAWRIVITVIGWLTLIKGLFMLFFPKETMHLAKYFMKNNWLWALDIVIALILGIYLLIQVM